MSDTSQEVKGAFEIWNYTDGAWRRSGSLDFEEDANSVLEVWGDKSPAKVVNVTSLVLNG